MEGRTSTCACANKEMQMSSASPSPLVNYPEVEASERFVRLKRKHRSFVLPIALLFLVWYFVYVLLAAYAHEFMATKVFGNVNVGLLFGLAQFLTTFAITTWYVIYANRNLDPLAEEIRGAGWHEVTWRDLMFGAVAVHCATRPEASVPRRPGERTTAGSP